MTSELVVVERLRIPLAEVSGLACLRRGDAAVLVAVGDNDASLATADVRSDGSVGPWAVVTSDDVGARPDAAARFRQLEAVAVDGAGRAWVVTEGTSLLGGIDLDAGAAVGGASLDAAGLPELDRHWGRRDASRSEGLLLLSGGHLVVAKEKDPAGLVEFGPAGDRPLGVSAASLLPPGEPFAVPAADPGGPAPALAALAWWPLPRRVAKAFADLSDLAPDGAGGVLVLSDESRRIGRLRLPLAVAEAVEVDALADLPKSLGKPEGLALLPGGVVAVADDRKDDRDNLWLFRFAQA